MARQNKAPKIWQKLREVRRGFIVSNDILERRICTLIVSVQCACYTQWKHAAAGRISQNEQGQSRAVASTFFVLTFYDTESAQPQNSRKIREGRCDC
jgi:hypothetical protein